MSDIDGFRELAAAFGDIARNLPKEDLMKAVKKGANIVKPAVISAAPVKTGALRGGIVLHKERHRATGKVVYDIIMDSKQNNVFQKPIKTRVRSTRPHAYYPASQEYGFYTRRPDGKMVYTSPHTGAVRIDKVPGTHFMRTGADLRGEAAKEAVAGDLMVAIEKRLGGSNGA